MFTELCNDSKMIVTSVRVMPEMVALKRDLYCNNFLGFSRRSIKGDVCMQLNCARISLIMDRPIFSCSDL